MTNSSQWRRSRRAWGRMHTGICAWLLIATLSACTSPSPVHEAVAEPVRDSVATSRDTRGTADGAERPGYGKFSRNVNSATGFLGIMLKTYTTDPLVRPVSTARSLGFLLKNTIVDFFKGTGIDMLRLPVVTSAPVPPLAAQPGMDLHAWEQALDRITGTTPSSGSLEFLVDGQEYFPALIESLENARESIQLRTYIFDNDDFAVGIADMLKACSREVDVKVMVDGIGTLTGGLAIPESMPASFEPPASIMEYLRSDSDVEARTLTNPWFSGDHSKITIIDRDVAYLGGMNIGREYRYDWHDLMVKVEGNVIEELARDSDIAWAKSGMLGELAAFFRYFDNPPSRQSNDGYAVRVLYTRAQQSQIYEAQLAAIRRARNHVYIENPYFSDDAILYELIAARRRGVDVRFVIAERGDMKMMDMNNVQSINAMLANGIRVYMYPGMTHVKATIVDDWLMVGSANLDKLSLRVNNEANIATSNPRAVAELKERVFEADFERSAELTAPLPTGPNHQLAEALADFFL